MERITEDFVEERIRDIATKGGFEILPKKKGMPDIVVRHKTYPKYRHMIEVKGHPGGRYTSAHIRNYFLSALGQVVRSMKSEHVNYGIAFPDIELYRDKVLELPKRVRKILSLSFYFVDRRGKVRVLKPSAAKLQVIPKLPESQPLRKKAYSEIHVEV